uniref:Coagulation factor II thrombin receptor like 2 n=1 Tax=Callorhinchus milii TaxID=7868 RepID=A0A4W3GHD1_CALMI|eukprot:gi/632974241/ref/XP_007903564.1/ PREDICTED: proteinase-activated receptor 3 [Callorhinchus milii]
MPSEVRFLVLVLLLLYCETALCQEDSKSKLIPKTFVSFPCPENNNTSELCIGNVSKEYFNSALSSTFIPAVYTTVLMLGFPSNAIALWMFCSKLRTIPTAIFNINLVISDLSFLATLPFIIHQYINGNNWVFGEATCRIITATYYGNMYSSIFFLTCISINWYLAIVHPFLYKDLPKKNIAGYICATIWLVVFLFTLPIVLLKQTYFFKELNIVTCHYVLPEETQNTNLFFYYLTFYIVCGFVIPLIITLFCYTLVIKTLHGLNAKWVGYIHIAAVVLMTFVICFAPSNVILLIHNFKQDFTGDNLYSLYLTALCLGSLNTCFDPFLYYYTYFYSKWKAQSLELESYSSLQPAA